MLPKKRAAVGDDGVQQPGLAAELDVDGAHGHMGFARNHLQADLAVAFFQEQAAGRVQQGGAAGGFVGGAGGRRPCRSTNRGVAVRTILLVQRLRQSGRWYSWRRMITNAAMLVQKMKCNRFIS
jgi:hypothetical protein